jgi:DNA polymerase-1
MLLVRNVDEAIERLKDETELGFDLETSGISPFRDRVAVITLYGGTTDVAAILHVRGHIPPQLKAFFERPGIEWIGHNIINFDFPFMYAAGVNVFNGQKYFDTLVASTVATITGRRNVKQKLDFVLERELGVKIDKHIVDHGKWMDPELNEQQVTYCLGDIVHLQALKRRLIEKCREQGEARALELELAILPGVLRMIINGMPVDRTGYDQYLAKQHKNATKFGKIIYDLLGEINLNSPAQVKKAFEGIGVQLASTSRDALKQAIYGESLDYNSDEEESRVDDAVTAEGHKIYELLQQRTFDSFNKDEQRYITIKLLLAFRIAEQRVKMFDSNPEKKKESWWDKYVTDGRVHCTYWSVGTDTGRWSSSNPNLQQIPTDMRTVFGHVPGHQVVSVDYSQIEVWVMALLSGDKNMLDYLESGDMHTRLGQSAFKLEPGLPIKEWKAKYPKERKKAKAMVFALLFGGGARRLYEYMRAEGVETSLEEATKLYLEFSRLFPKFHAFREAAKQKCAYSNAIKLQMPSGLVRLLVHDSLKYTTFLNTSVQGSAAAGLKNGLKMIIEEGLDIYLAAAVHDELVLVVPTAEAAETGEKIAYFMRKGMIEMLARKVPNALESGIKAEAGIGETWIH